MARRGEERQIFSLPARRVSPFSREVILTRSPVSLALASNKPMSSARPTSCRPGLVQLIWRWRTRPIHHELPTTQRFTHVFLPILIKLDIQSTTSMIQIPLELIRSNRYAVRKARKAHLIRKGNKLSPLGINRRVACVAGDTV